MRVPGLLGLLLFMQAPPHLPPRDYSKEALNVRAEEAIALQTATTAMQRFIKDHPEVAPLDQFYVRLAREAPSIWRATWEVNNINARGGAVEFTLDASGTKVISIRRIE